MNISSSKKQLAGHDTPGFFIKIHGDLTSELTEDLRNTINNIINTEISTVYIDATGSHEADLAGINEIIFSNFTLQKNFKKLVFAFNKNSNLVKWVETTGLNKFVATAITQ